MSMQNQKYFWLYFKILSILFHTRRTDPTLPWLFINFDYDVLTFNSKNVTATHVGLVSFERHQRIILILLFILVTLLDLASVYLTRYILSLYFFVFERLYLKNYKKYVNYIFYLNTYRVTHSYNSFKNKICKVEQTDKHTFDL